MKQKKKTEWSNLSREELLMLCIGDIIQVAISRALVSRFLDKIFTGAPGGRQGGQGCQPEQDQDKAVL